MTPFAGIAPSLTDIEDPPSATAHRPFGTNHSSSRSRASQGSERPRFLPSAGGRVADSHAGNDVGNKSDVAVGDAIECPGFDPEVLCFRKLNRIGDHVRHTLDHYAPPLLAVRLETVSLEGDHESRGCGVQFRALGRPPDDVALEQPEVHWKD